MLLKIDLKDYIRFGNGEISNSLRDRPAIIADAFEAVLGAIYLDQGFDVVLRVVDHLIIPYLDEVWNLKDYKSILQEKVQSDKRSLHYEIIKDTGPAHDKTFEAVVYMDDDILMGHGFGKTKKEAEQQAAREALQKEAKKFKHCIY
ncbi:MAG: putative dsRNA-binding protein [Clostridium sp.]|nr:MAG: putative dsRNA-binding protein [Clostridium sp.]